MECYTFANARYEHFFLNCLFVFFNFSHDSFVEDPASVERPREWHVIRFMLQLNNHYANSSVKPVLLLFLRLEGFKKLEI